MLIMGVQEPFRQHRVFLADDSELVRRQIVRALRETPEVVLAGQASSADEAVQGIMATQPDTAVVDLELAHGSSGWDVVERIRHLPCTVVILTNRDEGVSRSAAAERGIQHFFDKTRQFEDFLALLTVRRTK